jgi:TP901 family phage tail tape measure protein
MSDRMKLWLELGAKTRGLVQGLADGKGAVGKFAAGARKELSGLRRMFSSVQGQAASLGITIGAGKVIMDSARLDQELIRITQTAGAARDNTKGLRKELFSMGRESGKQIEELRDGFNDLVQSGLDMKQAEETLKGINIAAAVTGASIRSLSGGLTVGAEQFDFDLSKPGQALELLDKMTVAGRLGNAELEDLSAVFARIGNNATRANFGFEQTLAFVEALSLAEKNPERLATLVDSTMRVFTNMRYMASAQKGTGVKFFDDNGDKRDPFAVLADIKKKYDTLTTDLARDSFIQKAFGKADLDTQKGIGQLLKGDGISKLGQYLKQIEGASGILRRDFADIMDNLPAQGALLKNDLRKAADDFVQPIDRTLAKMIQYARASKDQGGLGLDGNDMILGGGLAIGGTMLAARYGSKAIKGLAGKFLKSGGSVAMGVAQGKALEAATGVQPVFVTNWPDGFGLGGASGVADTLSKTGAAGKKGLSKLAGRLSGLGRRAGAAAITRAPAAGGVAAAAAGGYAIGTGINELAGLISDKLSGGKYSGSGWLGAMIYEALHGGPGQAAPQNNIQLAVSVDQSGRVMTRSNDMNTRVDAELSRGNFM